ncbi:MAG: glycosyltransferase [Sandaracinaceae bacterium]
MPGRPDPMTLVATFLLGASLVATVVFLLGLAATVRHTARAPAPLPPGPAPAVSLLKPLKGDEEGLAENLRSFFAQDYPGPVEVVFATAEGDDPALPVARAVAAEFPHVPVTFVRSDPGFGLNPKVANLASALREARHPLVLQSDANVRVRPDYLGRVVAELLTEDGALLSSMVVGSGERSVGAALHSLQLGAFTAPGTVFALTYFGIVCVIGKSMLFWRRDLAEVGGLERVRDLLAEDYVLGRAFQRAGKKVLLSTTVVENVNAEASLQHFLSRHARWLKMRAVVHVPGFAIDLVANPLGMALLAYLVSGLNPWFLGPVLALLVLKPLGDNVLVSRTRGAPLAWRHVWLSPVRDVLLLTLWPYAAVSRSVEWRGRRLRLGWNSRLRPNDGFFARRWARRLWPARG